MKKIKKLIFEKFGQNPNYKKIEHRLIRVKTIMCSSETSDTFKRASIENQFYMSCTIIFIAMHTSMRDMNQFRIVGKKDKVYEYAIDEYFEEENVIEIIGNSIELLNDLILKNN